MAQTAGGKSARKLAKSAFSNFRHSWSISVSQGGRGAYISATPKRDVFFPRSNLEAVSWTLERNQIFRALFRLLSWCSDQTLFFMGLREARSDYNRVTFADSAFCHIPVCCWWWMPGVSPEMSGLQEMPLLRKVKMRWGSKVEQWGRWDTAKDTRT